MLRRQKRSGAAENKHPNARPRDLSLHEAKWLTVPLSLSTDTSHNNHKATVDKLKFQNQSLRRHKTDWHFRSARLTLWPLTVWHLSGSTYRSPSPHPHSGWANNPVHLLMREWSRPDQAAASIMSDISKRLIGNCVFHPRRVIFHLLQQPWWAGQEAVPNSRHLSCDVGRTTASNKRFIFVSFYVVFQCFTNTWSILSQKNYTLHLLESTRETELMKICLLRHFTH